MTQDLPHSLFTEVTELIRGLHRGELTLEEVADRFRNRTWSSSKRPSGGPDLGVLADPDPYVPGSFDEVVAAYDRGELTRDQYRTLAHAVAEASRSAHQPPD